jgi:hypothetical protein
MISYFKVFVYLLFPPAALLITLLIIPFPTLITRKIIALCDSILFCRPHPYIPIPLFWCVLLLSFLTFMEMYNDLKLVRVDYEMAKKGGNFDKQLIKLMVEERNLWISGFAFVLWVLLYKLCYLLKAYYDLNEQFKSVNQSIKELTQSYSVQYNPPKSESKLEKKDPVTKKNE